MKRTFWLLWLPVLAYYGLITLASSLYGDDVAGVLKYPFPGFDKVIHFSEYSVLGMVLARALSWEEYYSHLRRRWYIYFILILPMAALADEIHQRFVPGRDMNFFDWLADVSGATVGALALTFLIRRGRASSDGREKSASVFSRSDASGLGLIILAVYFVFMLAANILGHNSKIFRDDGNFLNVLVTATEYVILGFLSCRLFQIVRSPLALVITDAYILAGIGALFLCIFQVMLWLLQSRFLPLPEAIAAYASFIAGLALYRFGYLYLRRRSGMQNCH
jgi:VanZ family protein